MTLKEKYLKDRRVNQISIGFLYDYYINTAKTPVGVDEFVSIMQFANINEIIGNLDKEFGVNVLLNSKGEEIMIL